MGFASGFSAGANAVNSYESRKRQEKLDEQNAALHAERMDEIKQAKSDKQALRDAGAERTTMQGTAVTTGAGDKNLYSDPMQAANAAEDAKIEAEMRGQQPSMVNMQTATGITGKMAQGHQITTDPVDLKAINGAEAKAGRFQAALDAQGKPMEAMQMSNAVMENKAKALGLETAQLKFANEKFNTDVVNKINASTDWTKGLSQILTETQLGRLKGMTVNPVVSADGKMVSFVGDGPDGPSQPLATFPNTDDGKKQALQMLHKAPIETQISYLAERGKAASDAEKAALDERRVAAVELRANTDAKKLEALFLRGTGGSGGGGSGNGAGNSGARGVPLQDIYKRLESDFTVKDPTTGESRKDVGAIATVRNLVLQMPAAQAGDVDGAYLQAMQVYQKAQAIGKGDPVQTQQALAQILGGGKQEAYPKATDEQIKKIREVHGGAQVSNSGDKGSKTAAPSVMTMEQIQQQTRQNRERIAQQGGRVNADQEIQALKQQQAKALRAGKPMEANAISDQIQKLKTQRYGN